MESTIYLRSIPYEEYKDMNSVEVANLVQSRIQTKMDELEERA